MLDIRTGSHFHDAAQMGANGRQMTRRDFIGGGLAAASSVALAGPANASLRRGLGARIAAMSGGGGGSDPYHGYVASGLVCCCDGEDGWSDASWRDLTGNTDGFALIGGERQVNHLVVTSSTGPTLGFNQTIYDECSGDYTYEVEIDANSTANYQNFFVFYGNYMNMIKWTGGKIMCQFGTNIWLDSLRCLATMVMRRNDQSCDTYCNGVFVATTNPSTYAFIHSGILNLITKSANTMFRAYRMYNRVLMPHEIEKNAENYLTKAW